MSNKFIFKVSAPVILFCIFFLSCSDDYLPDYRETETVVFSLDSFVISGTGAVTNNFTDTLFLNPELDSVKITFSVSSDIDSMLTSSYGASIIIRDSQSYYLLKTMSSLQELNSSYQLYTRVGDGSLITFTLSGAFVSTQASFIKFKNMRVVKFLP